MEHPSDIASISQRDLYSHCQFECALLLFASDLLHVVVLVGVLSGVCVCVCFGPVSSSLSVLSLFL